MVYQDTSSKCRQEMAEQIYIIGCSLKTGKVPKEWKRVEIMHIFANENKEEPLNYRPISLIWIVCMICEKAIKKQWTDYLERERMIP